MVLVEMMWWKHVQASSTAADYQPYVALRYINKVKGNSFLRRVCSCNFSQNCEQWTLVCICPCLFSSFCLQCTQEVADLIAKEIWLAGQGGRHRNRPIFHVFHSNCTAVGIETEIK